MPQRCLSLSTAGAGAQRILRSMQVRVLFFGVLRDAFGTGELLCEVAGDTAPARLLLDQLRERGGTSVRGLWPQLAVAINQEYSSEESLVRDGDEVALLPPVSGGAESPEAAVDWGVSLTHEPLNAERLVAGLKAGSDGAVVVFDGIVRDNTRGRTTEYLVYEAYDAMALEGMRGLVREAVARFPVREAVLHHRLGRLEIGETSVLIAVASAHRGAAFDACRWIIDTLKRTVPIWKKEFFTDGAVWADGEPFPEELLPGEIR